MNKNIWALPRAERTEIRSKIIRLKGNIQMRYDKIAELLKQTESLKKLNTEDSKELRNILNTYSDAETKQI